MYDYVICHQMASFYSGCEYNEHYKAKNGAKDTVLYLGLVTDLWVAVNEVTRLIMP